MIDLKEIKKQIEGEVFEDSETLEKYSHDASIFEVRPEAVIYPKNSQDLKNLVTWVSKNKKKNNSLSITARSGGTCMAGGSINDSIILDFTQHFNRVLEVGKGMAVTEPGVYYRDFEPQTLKKNLLLPCYTASRSINTVGGMVGNNSAGEKTLSFGQTKDFVEELTVVLSDGNEYVLGPLDEKALEAKMKLTTFEGQVYRDTYRLLKENYDQIQKAKPQTSKNSAGYLLWEVWDKKTFNLAKLFTGSQGTLGLVTKIKFRLVKPKPESSMVVMFLKDLKPLGSLVKRVLEFKPETFESFDKSTFKLAMKYLPEMMMQMKGNIISLGFSFLPEIWLTLTGGVPELVLIAEFTDQTHEAAFKSATKVSEVVKKEFGINVHVTKSPREAQKYWTVRRESFNLLRKHVRGRKSAPFIDDIIVKPEFMPEFLPKLNAILQKYPSLIYTIAGHAGNGNFHIIPLMDLSKESERQIIPKLSEEVYDLVLKYQGSTTGEHNDGLIRTPYLEKMYGKEVCELFAQTKQIFDPLNIFNPRKKVNGDLAYAMSHIRTKS